MNDSLHEVEGYQRSAGADEKEQHYTDKFSKWLTLYAVRHMEGRRSNTLDESDYDHANQQILRPDRLDWKDKVQRVAGIIVGFIAASVFAFGYQELASPAPHKAIGIVTLLASFVLAICGAILQIIKMEWGPAPLPKGFRVDGTLTLIGAILVGCILGWTIRNAAPSDTPSPAMIPTNTAGEAANDPAAPLPEKNSGK